MSKKSFKNSKEAKDWFRFRMYRLPNVFERKGDWKFQWRVDGNLELATKIAEELAADGYEVQHVFGADVPNSLKMQICVSKIDGSTDVETIKAVCKEELYIGSPTIKELRETYKLKWTTKMADEVGLARKVNQLNTKYEVVESYITYTGSRYSTPSGYCIQIKKK